MSDYSTMTDRELDALVAEKVMGWKKDPRYPAEYGDKNPTSYLAPTGGGAYYTEDLPHYSSTGSGMLIVLDRMKELGWGWTAYSTLCGGSFAFIKRNLVFMDPAPILPRAVACAALKAVGA